MRACIPSWRSIAIVGAAVSAVGVVAAVPQALGLARGGLWQVSRSARGDAEQMLCIARPIALARYRHRGQRCEQTTISDAGNRVVVEYQCGAAGFGRSEMTLVTPRTLRISTQGIASDGPFNFVLHARRVGECGRR